MIVTAKASHVILSQAVDIEYQWSFLCTSRLRVFIEGELIGETPWDFLQFHTRLNTETAKFSIYRKPVAITVRVDHREKAYAISINGRAIVSSEFKPNRKAKSFWWYLAVLQGLFGIPATLLSYMEILPFERIGLSPLVYAFLGAVCAYYSDWRRWKKE